MQYAPKFVSLLDVKLLVILLYWEKFNSGEGLLSPAYNIYRNLKEYWQLPEGLIKKIRVLWATLTFIKVRSLIHIHVPALLEHLNESYLFYPVL